MLSKLIKYELKDASHSLFPIGLGMAILSVISALMVGSATKGFDLSRLPFYPLLSGLVGLLTFICVIAVVVICLMSNVGSFYRMLGHRGYLEMSLPVTIHQHIAAKLISAVLTTLLTLIFLNLCGFVIVLPNQPANWFSTMLGEGLNMLQNTPIGFTLLLVLFLLAGVAMFYLHTYLSCAIAAFSRSSASWRASSRSSFCNSSRRCFSFWSSPSLSRIWNRWLTLWGVSPSTF